MRRKAMRKMLVLIASRGIGCVLFVALVLLTFLPLQAQSESIELSFALHIPPKAALYPKALVPWAEEIEKRSDGQVKIKFYLSQTLVATRDSYDGVVNGIADISWFFTGWGKGRFPLLEVMDLPYLTKSTFAGSHVMTQLYEKFPEIQEELKDVKPLWFWTTMPYEIHTSKKPIKSIEDMKGTKFASNPGARLALEGAGAVAVPMGTPNIYQTVEKGVTDGCAAAWGSYKAFKMAEVTKYHTNVHLGGMGTFVIMNKDKWNGLSEDLQKIIKEVTAEMMPDSFSKAVTVEGEKGEQQSLDLGHDIFEISDEERAKWVKSGEAVYEKWVSDMEAKGLPGRAVLDEAIKLMSEQP